MILTHEEALAAARELDRLVEVERAAQGAPAPLTPRQAALAAGSNQYLGRVCPHGHVPAMRYARNRACVACVRLKEKNSGHRRARKAARRKLKARIVGWDKVK